MVVGNWVQSDHAIAPTDGLSFEFEECNHLLFDFFHGLEGVEFFFPDLLLAQHELHLHTLLRNCLILGGGVVVLVKGTEVVVGRFCHPLFPQFVHSWGVRT